MSFQRIKNAAFAEVRVQRKMLLIINILMGAGALTYGLNGIVTAMQDGEFFSLRPLDSAFSLRRQAADISFAARFSAICTTDSSATLPSRCR